jgi:uncharacterized protein YjbI with pentapeptide repeats
MEQIQSALNPSRLAKLIGVAFLGLILFLGWATILPVPAQADNYAKEILVGSDFSQRDLKDSNFTKANLLRSDLSRSDLRGVSFFAANLESANLESADLRFATLDSARLNDANLTNANLEGAFAFNAQFRGATITGADFTDVDVRDDVHDQLCQAAAGTNPTTGRNTLDTLNCD